MRTIAENLFYRLAAQAEEAELQGFDKIGEALTDQITKYSSLVRNEQDFYSYSEEDFQKDINSHFWSTIIRIADFYGIARFDASEFQNLIDKYSGALVKEICVKAGVTHGVGAYEGTVPGEKTEKADIEVTEGDV